MAIAPEVDPAFAADFLQRLPEYYRQSFAIERQAAHLAALYRLSPKNPVELLIDINGENQIECSIMTFDQPAVFAVITGILSGLGLNIIEGDAFTYAPADNTPAKNSSTSRYRRKPGSNRTRRRIIDRFLCEPEHPSPIPMEQWRQLLPAKFQEIFMILENQRDRRRRVRAKSKVDEMVAERLARLEADKEPRMTPLTIDIDNKSGSCTKLRVIGKDSPAFLYAFSNSLGIRNFSIEHVKIRTHQDTIEDELDIVDENGLQITDQGRLNHIKLAALLTKHFTYFLGSSPDPFSALSRFEKMLDDILLLPEQGRWADLLSEPKILQDLARLLGASDFIWEDFVRQQYEELLPMLAPRLRNSELGRVPQDLGQRLKAELEKAGSYEQQKQRLNEFKDREIYMIDLGHILSPEIDFKALASALTELAETVIEETVKIVYQHLASRFGTPRTVAGLEAAYAVFGLGKMGGGALGYASDIELLFVYDDNGFTDGETKLSNADFFCQAVKETLSFIQAKQEGIFNLDLRLRPHGNDGPLACSLENFCRYYSQEGSSHSFEKLALTRLRWIAGNRALGQQVERLRDEMVYFSRPVDLNELRHLRARQFREKTRPDRANAKFSPGGLVDLEYDVQILQVMYGRQYPELRTPRLHQALEALGKAGVLSSREAERLTHAYDFLRQLINGLRMLRGSARDLFLPPTETEEFTHLARRMGYKRGEKLSAAQQLRLDFDTYTATVRVFVEHHFGRESLPGPNIGNVADLILSDKLNHELARRVLGQSGYRDPDRALVNLRQLCRDQESRETFARLAVLACDMLRNQPDPDMALNNWEKFMTGEQDPAGYYAMLLSQPRRLEMLLAIFSASQFLADTLARHRNFLAWLTRPEILHQTRSREKMLKSLRRTISQNTNEQEWMNQLRVFRKREILRIGARDVCLHLSTEQIIVELSNLAEAITEAALEKAAEELPAAFPEVDNLDVITDNFCVLALGKLGGGELNYSSDIDLLALSRPPSGSNPELSIQLKIHTRLMERLCESLNRTTSEGHAYRVDLRLRPYGRSGNLVHTVDSLRDYYCKSASLWEKQALLKLRPVAGNIEAGKQFMQQLTPLLREKKQDREIFRSIEQMRRKAVKSINSTFISHGVDIKNDRGGIRDIEFLVQALQLRLIPEIPELIISSTLEAIRKLGEKQVLEPGTVNLLIENYLFLRRVEHCLQIYEDRQIHTLPTDDYELSALARRLSGTRTDGAELLNSVREAMRVNQQQYENVIKHAD